jgi:DNA polymerase
VTAGRAATAAGTSRQAAAQAKLDAIRERYIADAPHQHFNTTFTNIVFGEGDPCARLMFIGEAPGEDEDLSGRPFVGRAGQLLEKMINAMGLARADVYIANVLKTRPPGNATPTPEEADLCKPYLFDQIEAIRPEAIVTLGLPATKLILATTVADADSRTMASMRSIWAEFKHPSSTNPDGSAVTVPVMPTYHPAYVLRNYTDETRAKVWSDLKKVMDKLGLGAKATK